VPALIATGACETAVTRARHAFSEQIELPDPVALPGPGVHVINQIYALTECGRLEEASALAAFAYEATPANAPPDGLMWLSHQRGRSALVMGRLETATRWLAEAAARCEEDNILGPRRLVLSSLATAQAGLGDAAAAAATVLELDRLVPFPFVRAEQELGRAWARVVAGDLPGARDVLQAAAELAAESGYRVTEAWLLHDIARLGDPASVAGRLAELAGHCEGALVAAYAAHAAAAVSGRPQPLVEAADRFEGIGAMLLAAEAATEAAQAFQRAGDRRASAALGVRAAGLAASCEGARTPGLTAPVMVAPLTARERDIAALAAKGASSKDIADQLFLSVRTVNNHLQNVYSKLGVSGRRQLASALDDLTDISS
jgi:DNA-binding CsgD family transcriptional regulator